MTDMTPEQSIDDGRAEMSNYKLVPVEPTPEMVDAAREHHEGEAYLPVSLYKAMLAAAPAVQGEPVAYLFPDDVGRTRIVLGKETAEHWCPPNESITPLYTAPQPAEQQPAPDVAGLVSAAEFLLHRLREMEAHLVGDELCRNYLGHVAPAVARLEGLAAAHRKQGGK